MPHDLLNIRLPPAWKAWLEQQVEQRRKAGERKYSMTQYVLELFEKEAKAQGTSPVLD